MDLTLKRTDYLDSGIFGILLDENSQQIAVTLEHSYDAHLGDGSYTSKLPNGNYTCVKGQHRLASMTSNFTTFEITDVPKCTGILFHVGNFNKDSEGCVLLGTTAEPDNNPPMITNSKLAFEKFMALQADIDSFNLIVI